jgi:outer membrane protein assembly factor BamD (BamD/ComL family)
MAKRIKFTRKEIKSPDEFRKSISGIVEFVSDNYIKFLLGGGVIIIIIVALFSISIYRERQDLEANSKFQIAIGHYSAGNTEMALSEFTKIRDNYPDCHISDLALYYIGLINFENGKYDKAILKLNEFLSIKDTDTILKDAATYTIGVASFKKGRWQSAIDSLSKLDSDESPYARQSQLLLALALEKEGKRGEAEKIYQEMLTASPVNNLKF